MSGSQRPVGVSEFETPSGRLLVSGDLSFRALIRASVRSRDKVHAAVEATARLPPPMFLQCGGSRQDADGFHLTWPSVRGEAKSLLDLVPSWREYPAIHLPDVLALARCLYQASSEQDHLRPWRFLISPPQICRTTGASGARHWVIIPLPLEGAGLSDFVTASELSTAWLSGDELLGIASFDRVYLIGAVLYYCLVSDLVQCDLRRGERFRRRLSFRVGNLAEAKSVLQSAVPKALAAVAAQFADYVCDLLSPDYGRAMTPVRAVMELERFRAAFSPPQLAAIWEGERNYARAVAILNAFAESVEKSEVPWPALARLRTLTGDATGAAEARKNIVLSPEEKKAAFIGNVHAAAVLGPEGRADVEGAVARLREAGASDIDPEEFLFLAYMNGRFLGRGDESIQLLRREFIVSWHKVISAVLTARFAAESANWIAVSKACRDARRVVAGMPDRGGSRGRYANAFSALLDGIAHIKVVEAGRDPDYLNDAYNRFREASSEIRDSSLDDLRAPLALWLPPLARLSSAPSHLEALRVKVEALGRAVGADLAGAPSALLSLPWFDASRFFDV